MLLKVKRGNIVPDLIPRTNNRVDDTHEDAGMTYLLNKNYDEAADEFRIALEERKDSADINSRQYSLQSDKSKRWLKRVVNYRVIIHTRNTY